MVDQSPSPRVSVGVPVRNGAAELEHALRSLLAQTEADIEIVISDNASEDATAEICRRFAAEDARIRYFRQPTLLPVMDNFAFVLAQARAPLFMWAAHDDVREPSYVAVLAAGLDAHPDAVLAFGDVVEVVHGVAQRRDFDFSTQGLSPVAAMAKTAAIQCFHIYGLWRTEALRRVPLRSIAWWPDTPIMMAAAALGPFIHVPGTTLRYRFNPRPFVSRTPWPGTVPYAWRVVRRLPILAELVWRSAATVAEVAGPGLGAVAGGLAVIKILRQISTRLGLG